MVNEEHDLDTEAPDDTQSDDPYAHDPPASDRVRGINRRQEMGIIALLNEPTVRQAAKTANIPEQTMRGWLKQDAFKRAFREARREAFSQAISLTQRYAPLAVQALAKIIADEKVTASSRVQAAVAILKFSRESVELDEIVERVERLEQAASSEARPWTATDAA